MSSRDQIRAEIGRRLREHYDEAASQTIPDRLAQPGVESTPVNDRDEYLRNELSCLRSPTRRERAPSENHDRIKCLMPRSFAAPKLKSAAGLPRPL
jgi:hypothetical protein